MNFKNFPTKRYDIIYMDPPWDYGGQKQFAGKSKLNKATIDTGGAITHYPILTDEQLKQMPIPSICEKDCLLFCWVTGPILARAIEICESWDFTYKTVAFVWNKLKPNPGAYTMSETEQVLVFKKGCIPGNRRTDIIKRGSRNIRQLIHEKRTIHSAKPNIIATYIHEMFPRHKKIEIFARKLTKHFDYYGNQLSDF